MKTLIFILSVILFSVTEINAQSQWMQTPGVPEGGGITDMVIAENGNIVVTTASFNWPNGQDGGVRWSSDEGATWNSPFNYFNARTLVLGQNGWIFCSAWDFPDTERLYASSDNGQTWPMSLYTVGTNDNIFSILARDNNQTVYIGTRNGVLKSTNGGANFISINNGIPANSWVRDLNGDILGNIAAATTNGLFISTNAGVLWQQATGIPASDTIVTISINNYSGDGVDPLYLVGDNKGKIYNSIDNLQYGLLHQFPKQTEIVRIEKVVDTTSGPGTIHVWTLGGGYFRTKDNGSSWVNLNSGLPSNNPPVSAGIISNQTNRSGNGNTYKLYTGLYENSLNGAKVYSMDYTIGIQTISTEIPKKYILEQNYPNPFNPETKITFNIKEKSLVKITVFNALGKELDELVNEELAPGTYQTNFNGSGYNSGVYFYRLTSDNYTETKKMILIK